MSARSLISPRRWTTPIAAALLVVGCSTAHRPITPLAVATSVGCRATIDADGAADAPLAWSGPDDENDRERHDAWCAGVGPAVIVDAAAPVGEPVSAEAVVFVTWNAHVGGGDVAAFVRALQRGELTGSPARHVVLLLQEVYRTGPHVPARAAPGHAADRIVEAPPAGARVDIVQTARELGLALVYVPSMRNGATAREDRGNAILSSLPLVDPAAIELPFDRQRRVAVAAAVSAIDDDGRPWRVRVASSHLNATAGAARLWVFASGLRAAQARSLAAALDGDDPAVLGSDLNTWADGAREAAVKELRRTFNATRVPAAEATFSLGWQLDYLFFRLPEGWTATASRVASRFGSDHHPLLGRLQID